MSNPFLAEIRIFTGNFAPRGWAQCNGQLMPISQNTALFSLLGTAYGGDGKTTFALPNLQGSVPIQAGQGAGLSQYILGEAGGAQTVTLLSSQVPSHVHNFNCAVGGRGAVNSVAQHSNGDAAFQTNIYNSAKDGTTTMNPNMIAPTPASQPHNNMQPFVALTFIIALQGIFPSRS